MKKFKPLKLITLFIITGTFLLNCSDNNDSETYTVNQTDLDQVTTFINSFTGGGFAHGGPDGISPDSTIREIFASKNLDGTLTPGTLVTKRIYKKGSDGEKTEQLFVTFAMVKREAGYYPDGGDWEYIVMPNDGSTDYTTHPNGVLPDEGSSRGQLSSCAGCHASAGGTDFLYVNDN